MQKKTKGFRFKGSEVQRFRVQRFPPSPPGYGGQAGFRGSRLRLMGFGAAGKVQRFKGSGFNKKMA
jgi:hypothetical protein